MMMFRVESTWFSVCVGCTMDTNCKRTNERLHVDTHTYTNRLAIQVEIRRRNTLHPKFAFAKWQNKVSNFGFVDYITNLSIFREKNKIVKTRYWLTHNGGFAFNIGGYERYNFSYRKCLLNFSNEIIIV